MLPRIVDARYVSHFKVWLRFNDGVEGGGTVTRAAIAAERAKPDGSSMFGTHGGTP